MARVERPVRRRPAGAAGRGRRRRRRRPRPARRRSTCSTPARSTAPWPRRSTSRCSSSTRAGPGYRFRHALLREAVDAALLPGERRRLHRLVAVGAHRRRVARPRRARPPRRRAGRPLVGGRRVGARRWRASMDAADAAVAVWAFPEALAHLERALSAARPPARRRGAGRRPPRAAGAGRRRRLPGRRRPAFGRPGPTRRSTAPTPRRRPATRARRYAAARPQRLGDRRLRRRLRRLPPGRGARARRSAVGRAGPRPGRGGSRAHADVALRRGRGALPRGPRRGRGRRRRAPRRATSCARSGAAAAPLGHFDEGIALVREALAIAEELADPDALDRAYGNLSPCSSSPAGWRRARRSCSTAPPPARSCGASRLNGAAANSVEALIRLGRYDEAEALLAQTGERASGIVHDGAAAAAGDGGHPPGALRRGRPAAGTVPTS